MFTGKLVESKCVHHSAIVLSVPIQASESCTGITANRGHFGSKKCSHAECLPSSLLEIKTAVTPPMRRILVFKQLVKHIS